MRAAINVLLRKLGNFTSQYRTDSIRVLESIVELTKTEEITDSQGNEFILISGTLTAIDGFDDAIEDKTQFEAINNHVHVLDRVSRMEMKQLRRLAPSLCQIILHSLCSRYPNKYFYVFASATVHDSFILRFHQRWLNEIPYYEVKEDKKEWIICRSGSSSCAAEP